MQNLRPFDKNSDFLVIWVDIDACSRVWQDKKNTFESSAFCEF